MRFLGRWKNQYERLYDISIRENAVTTQHSNQNEDTIMKEYSKLTPELQASSSGVKIQESIPKMSQHPNRKNDVSTKDHPKQPPESQVSQKRKRNPQDDFIPREKKREIMPPHSLRYDQTGHFIRIDKSKVVRCKLEGCVKKTYISCTRCNVHLCICVSEERNCFTKFHVLEKNK